MPPTFRKLAVGLALAAVSLTAAFLLSRVPLFQTMEWKIYDLEFQQLADHPRLASPEIVMVKIDDFSVERMAENGLGRFPWPRDTYAVLLDFLQRAKPRVVAFDVMFLEEDKSTVGDKPGSDADRELVDATRRLGNVVHAIDVNDTLTLRPETAPEGARAPYRLSPQIEEHRSVKLPFASLAEASSRMGHTFIVLDADGPVRRQVPFVRQGDAFYPSLAVATAMAALDLQPSDVRLDDQGLHLGNRRLPLLELEQEYVEKIRVQHMLIPYKGSAYTDDQRDQTTYRSYRFFDIFLSELQLQDGQKPEIDPSVFKDKIVFVGTTAAGTHDLFQTPYGEAGKMPGMQIHANVVDGILSQSFVRPAGRLASALLPTLSTITAAILGVFIGFWWSLLSTAVIALTDTGMVAWNFRQGVWIPAVPAALGLVFAEFSSVAYKYFVEDRAKRQVSALFSRYVSPHVVKALIRDPSMARLGGQRREMTVLFSDIRGFTTLSEASPPEQIIGQLNEYFSHMVEILFHHQGTLDKFVGDMIMALFNAPLDDPDHADHAVQMGIAMLKGLEELNRKWASEGKPPFDIGIGINTGEMIVGNVGSEKTLSYTVIGDNVNLGSRLESLNKEYKAHIIISGSTYRQLKGSYPIKPLGSVKVKGKTREVDIYEVCI